MAGRAGCLSADAGGKHADSPIHSNRLGNTLFLRGVVIHALGAMLGAALCVSNAAAQSAYARPAPAAMNDAGRTDFNMTDRVALTQLIHAYSIEVDRFNIDGWFALFTDDAVFSVGLPGMVPVEQSGEAFRSFWRTRFGDFERSGNRRKHLISNILFTEQNETSARAVISGLITNAKDGRTFTVVSGVDYEGWFVKQAGVWRIKRWNDRPDVNFEARQ